MANVWAAQIDVTRQVDSGGADVYAGLNLLVRRKPKENNFKAILDCIRDLMNEDTAVPEWLHDIFLGYGDPAAAQYRNMRDAVPTLDFKVRMWSSFVCCSGCAHDGMPSHHRTRF